MFGRGGPGGIVHLATPELDLAIGWLNLMPDWASTF